MVLSNFIYPASGLGGLLGTGGANGGANGLNGAGSGLTGTGGGTGGTGGGTGGTGGGTGAGTGGGTGGGNGGGGGVTLCPPLVQVNCSTNISCLCGITDTTRAGSETVDDVCPNTTLDGVFALVCPPLREVNCNPANLVQSLSFGTVRVCDLVSRIFNRNLVSG